MADSAIKIPVAGKKTVVINRTAASQPKNIIELYTTAVAERPEVSRMPVRIGIYALKNPMQPVRLHWSLLNIRAPEAQLRP